MSHVKCQHCGSKNHTVGFGLAYGGYGAYVTCNDCDKLIEKTIENEDGSEGKTIKPKAQK